MLAPVSVPKWIRDSKEIPCPVARGKKGWEPLPVVPPCPGLSPHQTQFPHG